MHNYLPLITPDYATPLSISPVGEIMPERPVFPGQVVDVYDDKSEERISFSDTPVFRVAIPWSYLTATDAETILDFFFDPTKANGLERSFPWPHPTDGYQYVVKFDSIFIQDQGQATNYAMSDVVLMVFGVDSGWTTAPTTTAPTVTPTTMGPTTPAPTVSPTTPAPTDPPTTVLTTVPPTTTAPTTVGPTDPPTTVAPTTMLTTLAPTVSPTTPAPATVFIFDNRPNFAWQDRTDFNFDDR